MNKIFEDFSSSKIKGKISKNSVSALHSIEVSFRDWDGNFEEWGFLKPPHVKNILKGIKNIQSMSYEQICKAADKKIFPMKNPKDLKLLRRKNYKNVYELKINGGGRVFFGLEIKDEGPFAYLLQLDRTHKVCK